MPFSMSSGEHTPTYPEGSGGHDTNNSDKTLLEIKIVITSVLRSQLMTRDSHLRPPHASPQLQGAVPQREKRLGQTSQQVPKHQTIKLF